MISLKKKFTTLSERSKSNGFTLIELLVVIAIISILIALGSTSYQRAVRLSRDSKRKTDLEQIRQALETYRSENGVYPDTKEELEPDYIMTLPSDPTATNSYFYEIGGTSTTYTLCSALEVIPSSIACDANSCGLSCNYQTTNP